MNVDGKRGSLTFEADQDARTIDVYGEARLHAGDVTFVGGAIYTNGMREQDKSFPAPVSAKATFNQLSPRVGAIWQPTPNVDVYANYSRSHELPGFIELAQVASFVRLKAQHAWTAEIGTRGHLGPARWESACIGRKCGTNCSSSPSLPTFQHRPSTPTRRFIRESKLGSTCS